MELSRLHSCDEGDLVISFQTAIFLSNHIFIAWQLERRTGHQFFAERGPASSSLVIAKSVAEGIDPSPALHARRALFGGPVLVVLADVFVFIGYVRK